MKKCLNLFPKEFKMPHIFVDNLLLIENIITVDLKPEVYEIKTDKIEGAKNINEVFKEQKIITEFEISCSWPYLSINFNRSSAKIYGDEDIIAVNGVALKILSIIRKRERKYLSNFLRSWVFLWVLIPLITFSLSPYVNHIFANIFVTLSVISFFLMILAFPGLIKYSKIENYYSEDKPNFFKQNIDKIVIAVISAFFGALFTILLSRLIK